MLTELTVPQAAGLCVALAACVTDLRSRRIPNLLTLGGAAAGFAYAIATGGATGGGMAALGWVLGVLLFFPVFALGGLGGGDVKLLGAIGAWLGPGDVLFVGLYGAIAGGFMALVVGAARGYLRTAFSNLYFLAVTWRVGGVRPVPELTLDTARSPRLAYALPVFAGLAVTLWLEH